MSFDPEVGSPARIIAAETLYSSHYFYARLQLFVLYTDTEDPDLTYALYVDRLLFDDTVGTLQRRVVRSGVVDDVGKRLAEVAAKHRSP